MAVGVHRLSSAAQSSSLPFPASSILVPLRDAASSPETVVSVERPRPRYLALTTSSLVVSPKKSSMLKRWHGLEDSRDENLLENVENCRTGKRYTPIVRQKRIVFV